MTKLVVTTIACLAGAPLAAQDISAVAVGETAGDDVNLLLLGISAAGEGEGLQPVVGVQGYRVGFPGGHVWSLGPAAGLRYRMSGGYVQGKVGYSFKSREGGDFPFFGGADDGFTTSAHAEYWGSGAVGLQGIASYNWGSDFLWSRARGTVRVAELAAGNLNVGAEAVWQGEFEEDVTNGVFVTDPPEEYRATMLGPVVQWISQAGWIAALGGGWKDDNLDDASTWYVKAEVVLPLSR